MEIYVNGALMIECMFILTILLITSAYSQPSFLLVYMFLVLFLCFSFLCILGPNRNSFNFPTPPGSDGPRPMAIFELLEYIVNEVCYEGEAACLALALF